MIKFSLIFCIGIHDMIKISFNKCPQEVQQNLQHVILAGGKM
jgi:hypothetical protein